MKKILYFLVTVVNGWNANILIKNNFQEKINIIEKQLGNKTRTCFNELFYYLIDNKNIESFKRDEILSRINFASPYIELPKKLTVKQVVDDYAKGKL